MSQTADEYEDLLDGDERQRNQPTTGCTGPESLRHEWEIIQGAHDLYLRCGLAHVRVRAEWRGNLAGGEDAPRRMAQQER
jgi:hypothetical protein